MMNSNNTDQRAVPPPPLAELIERADLVLTAEVESSTADACWLRVERVIRGTDCESRIRLQPTGWPVGMRGGFVLSGPEPFADLTGEAPDRLLRRILRIEAGLPELEPPMSSTEILALEGASDAVVLVRFEGINDAEADAKVVQLHRGELPPDVRLVRGDVDLAQPGGPWCFGAGAVGFATVFVRKGEVGWVVLNDRDPRLCRLDQVVAAERTTSRPEDR